jgi:hypothetical protein
MKAVLALGCEGQTEKALETTATGSKRTAIAKHRQTLNAGPQFRLPMWPRAWSYYAASKDEVRKCQNADPHPPPEVIAALRWCGYLQ